MTGKHTRGRWYAVGSMVEVADDAIPDICSVDHTLFFQGELPRPVDEMLANARLIAAAPDLLEACEAADRMFSEPRKYNANTVSAAIRAAIARATGEA